MILFTLIYLLMWQAVRGNVGTAGNFAHFHWCDGLWGWDLSVVLCAGFARGCQGILAKNSNWVWSQRLVARLIRQFSRIVPFVIGSLKCDTFLGVTPASWWDHAKCIAVLFELRVDSGTLYLENHGGTKKHHRIQLNLHLLWASPAVDRSSGDFIIIQSSLAETWWLHVCHCQSYSQRLETGMVWILWGCQHWGLEFGHEVRMADGHPGLWKGKGKIFGTELGVLQHHQLCMRSSTGMVTWSWDTFWPKFVAFASHSPHLYAGGTFMCPQPEVLARCTASGANQWSHCE